MEEIWKEVNGYNGMYLVSNFGKVASNRRGKLNILKCRPDTNGYPQAHFCVNYIVNCFRVSRLVAIHFIDQVAEKPDVNHIDGNKLNNHQSNLEWVSKRENATHRNMLHKNMKKSSKYPGVHFIVPKNKWISEIRYNKKKIIIGHYDNEIDAYNAYCNKLSELNISNKYLIL